MVEDTAVNKAQAKGGKRREPPAGVHPKVRQPVATAVVLLTARGGK